MYKLCTLEYFISGKRLDIAMKWMPKQVISTVVPFILILEMANPTCPLRAHCRTHILRDSMQ